MTGAYIVFEGGEYVGKSTQAALLAERIDAKLVREPGSTPVGEAIRGLLLDSDMERQVETETLLHAAQRSELARTVIRPTLQSGRHVVADRSWFSSLAYQGAQGLGFEQIHDANRLALDSLTKPDVWFVLDADPQDVAVRAKPAEADYYEQKDVQYHQQLRTRFLGMARQFGGVVIDALQDREVIASEVYTTVKRKIDGV